MKNYLKRCVAALLAVVLLGANIPGENVWASETTATDRIDTPSIDNDCQLNYLIVEQSYVETPGTQNIVVSIGDSDSNFERAVLSLKNRTADKELQVESAATDGAGILFTVDFSDESQSGCYEIVSVTYTENGTEYELNMADAGIEAVFGVNTVVEDCADAYFESAEEAEADLSIVSYDENGNLISDCTMEEAIANAQLQNQPRSAAYSARAKSNYIVVLDPGHDSKHSGTQANNLAEEKLNLKIAQYCKAELEQYNGITVYMTRSGEGCPYSGDSVECNKQRVEYASKQKADLYISLHVNYNQNASPHGAGIYYPNKNYKPDFSTEGKALAQEILSQLNELGVDSWGEGLFVRNSEDGTKYPDGSRADYYGVIRRSKEAGIPAIIVEHAFQSNASDVNNFLNSDEKLKKLGVADATGIAKYLNLSKGQSDARAKTTIENVDAVSGSFDVVISDVQSSNGIRQIQVPIWSQDGQKDIIWYQARKRSDGSYAVHVDISNHNCNYGIYKVHTYVVDEAGKSGITGITTVELKKPKTTVSIDANEEHSIYTVSAANMPGIGGQSLINVEFAVWSENGGQDDLVWYDGVLKDNAYEAEIPISRHKTTGLYYVHIYGKYSNGQSAYLAGGNFQVSIGSAKIEVANVDSASGSFDVVISDVKTPAGVKSIEVPIWSQDGQKDIVWYQARKKSNGSYVVHVDVANHDCNYGTYKVHAYLTNGLGVYGYVGGVSVKLDKLKAEIGFSSNSDQSVYTATVTNVSGTTGKSLKSVQFAVWSQTGGQDDLVWYTGKEKGGKYIAEVDISRHKTAGLYFVHVYGEYINGKSEYLTGGTFQVSAGSAKIEAVNVDAVSGGFDVVISDVKTSAGVKNIEVPIWSQDGQKDIVWYQARKRSDGSYVVHVDVANHNCNYGTYRIHTYLTNGLGVYGYVGGVTVRMERPQAKINISANSTETVYTATVVEAPGATGQSLRKVQFAVWSLTGGQDDLVWYEGKAKDGKYVAEIDINRHKTVGKYSVHVYGTYANGKESYLTGGAFEVSGIKMDSISVVNVNEADGTFEVRMTGVSAAAGISRIEVPVWCATDQSDIVWYNATKLKNGVYSVYVDIKNHKSNVGNYKVHVYGYTNNGMSGYLGGTSCKMINVSNSMLTIVGSTAITVKQMVDFYNANEVYPDFYANSDAPTIEQFCRIYMEECQYEGIKAEVAFCQMVLETGFLRYRGDMSIEQYNFAGIGATGGGVPGYSFPDVRTGVRAQIQHLKAYASTSPLVNSCVDPRFDLVKRGSAPYVEWLGIQENPEHVGWAASKDYGYHIRNNYINRLLTY